MSHTLLSAKWAAPLGRSLLAGVACAAAAAGTPSRPWDVHGPLGVPAGSRILRHADGTPFLWLGCTAWGMTEWLSREEVDLYLDDRHAKGMSVVQLCLFWGKRVDRPTRFTVNPRNYYGHRAFRESAGGPDALYPDVVDGGTSEAPNDYWDHVDYCLDAIQRRGMYAAVLPIWGRRYVNASHPNQSARVFTERNIRQYGKFLGERLGRRPNLIWVAGGDVKATEGGDHRTEYRLLAEGLARGVTGQEVRWDARHPAWDSLLLTYHPDGTPLVNSSEWFHEDAWLDLNLIETWVHRDAVATAIRNDWARQPVKPTIMAEGHYEGETAGKIAEAVHVRRQLYQSFFAGAAGFTYGGAHDPQGNGPLFGPSNNWIPLLQWEGAGQIRHIKPLLQAHHWWNWKPEPGIIASGRGEGEREKLAVTSGARRLVYFPEATPCVLALGSVKEATWFNPRTGESERGRVPADRTYVPPAGWEDAVLVLE